MISKGFYVWTSDDRFKNLSPIEIFINSNGGITLCEESDDNMPIELQVSSPYPPIWWMM